MPYYWTALDALIKTASQTRPRPACGGGPQCSITADAHTCYVTPYGIPPEALANVAVGTAREDVRFAASHEVGRAARFHDLYPTPDGEWEEFTVPADVTTLGQLVAYLTSSNPTLYPPALYPDVPTAARMLFDYMGNSEYRFHVVNHGFDWGTYTRNPGSIPVASAAYETAEKVKIPSVAIKFVVHWQQHCGGVACGGDTDQSVLVDQIEGMVESYITRLTKLTDQVTGRIELTNTSLAGRLESVRMLRAVAAIAEATYSNDDGMPSQGNDIIAMLGAKDGEGSDKIIGKATEFFMKLPVTSAGDLLPPPAPAPWFVPLEIAATVCLIASGVISIADTFIPAVNSVEVSLVAMVRSKVAWQILEDHDPAVKTAMDELADACAHRELPFASHYDPKVRDDLARAGVPGDVIARLCPDTRASTGAGGGVDTSQPG